MSTLFYVINRKNLCKGCEYAKDRFRDSCYCVMYGIIITYGKEKCKGYEPVKKQEEEQ